MTDMTDRPGCRSGLPLPMSLARSLALALFVVAVQPAWSSDDCDAPPESWQPRSAVTALAQRNGWQVDRLKIDDGCYEIKGRDADGRRFKAKLDPATLKVLRLKRERGDRDRDRERDRVHDERRAPAPPTPGTPPPAASAAAS